MVDVRENAYLRHNQKRSNHVPHPHDRFSQLQVHQLEKGSLLEGLTKLTLRMSSGFCWSFASCSGLTTGILVFYKNKDTEIKV